MSAGKRKETTPPDDGGRHARGPSLPGEHGIPGIQSSARTTADHGLIQSQQSNTDVFTFIISPTFDDAAVCRFTMPTPPSAENERRRQEQPNDKHELKGVGQPSAPNLPSLEDVVQRWRNDAQNSSVVDFVMFPGGEIRKRESSLYEQALSTRQIVLRPNRCRVSEEQKRSAGVKFILGEIQRSLPMGYKKTAYVLPGIQQSPLAIPPGSDGPPLDWEEWGFGSKKLMREERNSETNRMRKVWDLKGLVYWYALAKLAVKRAAVDDAIHSVMEREASNNRSLDPNNEEHVGYRHLAAACLLIASDGPGIGICEIDAREMLKVAMTLDNIDSTSDIYAKLVIGDEALLIDWHASKLCQHEVAPDTAQ